MSTLIEKPPAPERIQDQPPAVPEAAPFRRRRRKHRPGSIALDSGLYVALLLAIFVMAFPLIWMLLSSFKSTAEISAVPIQWLPQSWSFENCGRRVDSPSGGVQ